jgi:hypothetical protein
MTDFVLSSGNICRPYRTPWGGFVTKGMQVSSGVSSAAIVIGRPVTLDYTEAGNTSNASHVKASTGDNTFYLVGIAAQTVSGSTATEGNDISVWEANPMQEFRAVTKAATLQSSHVGLCKTLHWDSTLAIAYVDLSASTASDFRVLVTGLLPNYSQGDSGGEVSFRFLTNSYNQGSTRLSSTPYLAFYR